MFAFQILKEIASCLEFGTLSASASCTSTGQSSGNLMYLLFLLKDMFTPRNSITIINYLADLLLLFLLSDALQLLVETISHSTVVAWRTDSLKQTTTTQQKPDVGKGWSQKETGQQRVTYLDSVMDSMDMNLSLTLLIMKGRKPVCCSSWSRKEPKNSKILNKETKTIAEWALLPWKIEIRLVYWECY